MEKSGKEKPKKTEKRQFEIYLEYLKRYNILKMGWLVQRGHLTEVNNIWQDMTMHLNSSDGPVRETSHWKKVFTEWKSHTRRKLKHNKPLNDIEKELVELTGVPVVKEKKKHLESLLKDKNTNESNKSQENKENERNVSKNDLIIKEEISDEWSDTTRASFMEEEVIDSSNDEVHPTTRQKIVRQEKQDVNKKHIAKNGKVGVNGTLPQKECEDNEMQTESEILKLADKQQLPDKNTATLAKKDVSVQVDKTFCQISNNSRMEDLTHIGNSLLALSGAINRYCDIVERRIF